MITPFLDIHNALKITEKQAEMQVNF